MGTMLEKSSDKGGPTPGAEPCFNNAGRPLKVPGFGYAVNIRLAEDYPQKDLFRHGVNDFAQSRLVAREVAMLALMDSITDKPRWHEKVFDESIVEKWQAEATQLPLISSRAWDWCLRELREKADCFAECGFVRTLDTGSACAKADDLIDAGSREDLLAGVDTLMKAKEDTKDWHPGTNEKVLNLVHPSLFPLVYGRTQVLHEGTVGLLDCVEYCGKGTTAPEQTLQQYAKPALRFYREDEVDEARFSTRFQWLPAEVRFTGAGSDAQFTSYINNLHPLQHKTLYSSISRVVSKVIPMWNQVLVKDYDGCMPPRIMTMEAKTEPPCPPDLFEECVNADDGLEDPMLMAKVEEYLALPEPPECDELSDDEEDRSYKDGSWKDDEFIELSDAVEWKYHRLRKIVHPEPGESCTFEEWMAGKGSRKLPLDNPYWTREPILHHDYYKVNLEKDFRDQGLQVIVKLASVELTPEKPEYEGGSWHLEGMMNEHIVATAIYYYDVENISESRLSFRTESRLSDDLSYEQGDHAPLAEVFGASRLVDEPAIQNLGTLQCKPGRILAFPNTLQHRVEPFSLTDPTRAGHRRFLVLWLVDPNYRVASTANVPPQQHDWVAPETVDKVLAEQDLAAELQDMIKEHTADYPMSLETAKALRLELMQERTRLMPSVESKFETYNLCEH